MTRDWVSWHDDYDRPRSGLRRRLAVVQRAIRTALDSGAERVVSLCAGQGRDLLPVLAAHPRRGRVRARLVELDERNARLAEERAPAGVEVVCADAALTDAYAGAVPADLVLACGLFGNLSDADVRRTISALPQLCAPGATVVWTRHTHEPDLVPSICGWFEESGFDRAALETAEFGVGVHRYAGPPTPLRPGERMFTFFPQGPRFQESPR
ncbi:class I SAM-dependent methyltransferase [Nonomuraea sp. SBT364]|uniref:class I SAM-dependent methyltransferase n=1 Tax=Nonomuraea sp. SBT364 TaxID=1580530 RepID=UPI00066DDCFC|nr:class I SAM-dependent methyltransferase [Nonomuraea sp. SBT364]